MIRLAIKKDAQRILELLNSDPNLRASDEDKTTKQDVKQYLTDNIHRIYVYEINRKVVGVLVAQFFRVAKYIYLFYIAVDKKYQKKGIATQLFSYLESIAKKERYYLIYLFTKIKNTKMKNFIKKRDYKLGGQYIHYYKILK